MKKYILLLIGAVGTMIAVGSCKKYDEEPPRNTNPIYMKYKMPEVERLNVADQEVVKQIKDEYEKSQK